MDDSVHLQNRLIATFVFDLKSITKTVKTGKVDVIIIIFLLMNIFAVGFASAQRIDSTSIFFPGLDKSISFISAFSIGIVFQIVVIFAYSYLQTFLLELFESNVTFNRALIMIAHAGLWFIPAALLINTSLIIALIFAVISFITMILIMQSYTESTLTTATVGISIASLITGLLSLILSLIILLIV